MLKKNWSIILISTAVVVLAVIAILTATKLYQLREQPVAPTVPQPAPAAEETGPVAACTLNITVEGGPTSTPTPTRPTSTPTPTKPTSTPTPTEEYGCYNECSSDSQCEGDLRCQEISGVKRCLNPDCPTERDCVCNKDCWDVCGATSECPSGLECRQVGATKRCVNPDCEEEQDCDCTSHAQATSTPTTYVAQVELPEAGISWPTIFGLLVGVGLAILGLGL
jgi:hypothetical protein